MRVPEKGKAILAFLKEEYEGLVAQGLDWKIRVLESGSSPRAIVEGKELLMLCSNNYLNLTNHPKVKEAMIRAVEKYGVGSGAVRAIAGTMDVHLELEGRVAEFKRREAALVYPTGYMVNSGLIPQLVGEGDLVISDELNHGSIIDGVRLTKADRAIYSHCNVQELEGILKDAKGKGYRRILIATDGVFSMDGDIAPLDRIVEIADQYGAMTYVDDAHGDGVLGDNGRGISSYFNIEGRVDVEMGTFSKAFGVIGGYVAGSRDLITFAYNKSRTWLLSASLPPPVAAACKAALDVVETEPEHLKRLWDNTRYFKEGLRSLGFDIGKSKTPITPVIVGESGVAKRMGERLFEEGVFATPIVYPMVAKDKARIRTIISSGHTKDDLDFALEAFKKVGRQLGVI